MADASGNKIVEIDIARRLAAVVALDPAPNAVQYGGRWLTWGELRTYVERVTDALDQADRARGRTAHGTRVGLITRNRPGHLATIQAVLTSQRCLVPITSIASDTLIAAEVERLGIGVLVADDEDWSRSGLAERCRALGIAGIAISADTSIEVASVGNEHEHQHQHQHPEPGVAVLMPTSGTTGTPKRIRYTYDKLNGAMGRVATYSPATVRLLGGPPQRSDGVVLAILSIAHIAGFWAVLQAMCEGRPISLLDRFEPHAWADLVEEHQAKLSSLPPATVRMVLDAGVPKHKISTLLSVFCGTAPLDPDVADEFTEKYGVPILTAYGATEFPGGLVGWNLPDYKQFRHLKRGSAGRARPGNAIKITHPETRADLPFGDEGIISARSPQATADADPDGWVHTNDYGRMDEDGFLWVLGRADDAINRGGFKVVPQVVEKALREHPAVIEAGVAGMPDARLGEVPVAAVTARSAVTEAELVAFLVERLAKHHIPVEIRVVDELPRTPSLKISKDGLRELFATPA